jgi:hypothetical protein
MKQMNKSVKPSRFADGVLSGKFCYRRFGDGKTYRRLQMPPLIFLKRLWSLPLVWSFVAAFVSFIENAYGDDSGSVLTQHNDNMRSGAYLVEKRLTPAAVDPATGPGMALKYWRPVDGVLTTQLLYVRGVRIGPRERDVIYAFASPKWPPELTSRNTIYAYDANEEGAPGTTRGHIWTTALPATPHPTLKYPAWSPGGTPVIDRAQNTLFVVYGISNNLFPPNGQGDGDYKAEFHLAALDIQTGKVLRDVVVSGSAPSNVQPGHVEFLAHRQAQRAGLLLAPNPVEPGHWIVYVAFGSRWEESTHNWHGWVMGYDAETFAPRGVFCSTPDQRDNGNGGGIWQGGAGLAADKAGNVYFSTGNGPGSDNDGVSRLIANHGNSFVKLTPVRRQSGAYDFDVQAFSAAADDPAHKCAWANHDIDLGAGGVTVIPDSSQLVGGGKTGVMYLMDRRRMTKDQSFEAFDNTYDSSCPPPSATDPCPLRSDQCSRYRSWDTGPHLHGAPTYWQLSPDRGLVFDWGEKDKLKRFDHDRRSGRLVEANTVSGDLRAEGQNRGNWVMPGGLISLSANGTRDGLLWINLPWKGGGRILAYDARSLSPHDARSLSPPKWDTTVPFPLSHNSPPTVADGRVIVGSEMKFLVYGLRGPPQNCQPVLGCNANVTFNCDMINEIVVLQRMDTDRWHDVSIDSDPSRETIPFINDSGDGRNSALYRICSRKSGNDICTDPVSVNFNHSRCSVPIEPPDVPPLPQCGGHPCPHHEQ